MEINTQGGVLTKIERDKLKDRRKFLLDAIGDASNWYATFLSMQDKSEHPEIYNGLIKKYFTVYNKLQQELILTDARVAG